jgi:hypothetical protein
LHWVQATWPLSGGSLNIADFAASGQTASSSG